MVKFTTIRAMIAVAALKKREIIQADVTTAYLHADIDQKIYSSDPCLYIYKGKRKGVEDLLQDHFHICSD